MRQTFDRNAVVQELKRQATSLGLQLAEDSTGNLTGEKESIRAKWWLGGRSVKYRMSCRLREADHCVLFREIIAERSWGIPPPTASFEKTTVSGWRRSGERVDASIGGGGGIDYAQVRDALERASIAAGWNFVLEGGRLP